MATYVLVRHKVRDYTTWKPVYDADLPNRVKADLTEKHLLRGIDDTNEIFILFEAGDLSLAKGFVESPALRETMEKAGVIGRPDVHFLSDNT